MKLSRASVLAPVRSIPALRFDEEEVPRLTSYAGLVIYQALFARLKLVAKLRECFAHLRVSPIFGYHRILLLLILQLTLGFRKLRDRDYFARDPMILRILGLSRLPDVSTSSRQLATVDAQAVENVRGVSSGLVLDRIAALGLPRITLDYDGSVLSTSRHAEGSAVGFNKRKKGARSYYPLFCTVAQTGQILDFYHRPGNVHDSNGSLEFTRACFGKARARLPRSVLESRLDSAFFNDDLVLQMDRDGIEFTISTPFERFPELKGIIESRRRWTPIDETWSYFECDWKPKSWGRHFRFVFVRQKALKQVKGPLQLDLFIPRDYEYQYKVIVTNKKTSAKKVLMFHNGRGEQEGILAEGKSFAGLEYIPVRGLHGNQLYCLASVLTHNLSRELQMQAKEPSRGTTEKRSPLWVFESLNSLRLKLLHRAGRLLRPQGKLTLTLAANPTVDAEMLRYLAALGVEQPQAA